MAEKVHAAGGICVPELWHVGLIYRGPDILAGEDLAFRPELGQVSPSGFIAPGKQVCDGMTQGQIDDVIAAYARGAAKAVELGFDGIELHAARQSRAECEARLDSLTAREREIAELVALGRSSRNIAELLNISSRTVENHRARAMEKLDVSSSIELAQYMNRAAGSTPA